jgi:hypothetical protein
MASHVDRNIQQPLDEGRVIAQAISRWLPIAAAGDLSWVWWSEICDGKCGPGWVFSQYFGFPCQSSFHQILYHNHTGQITIGQSVAPVPSAPSWTPPPSKRIKKTLDNSTVSISVGLFLLEVMTAKWNQRFPPFIIIFLDVTHGRIFCNIENSLCSDAHLLLQRMLSFHLLSNLSLDLASSYVCRDYLMNWSPYHKFHT